MKSTRLTKFRWSTLLLLGLASAIPAASFGQETSLQAEVDALKQKVADLDNVAVRSQSHMMMDVEFQFANLWFAAKHQQWDLAAFFMRETQSHIAWTVRVRPVRNVTGGGTVELKPFQQAIEQGGLTPIKAALEMKDGKAFRKAYEDTLPLCHSCHVASGLGYLEPHIPKHPPSVTMIKDE
jgi:hypothetical protein